MSTAFGNTGLFGSQASSSLFPQPSAPKPGQLNLFASAAPASNTLFATSNPASSAPQTGGLFAPQKQPNTGTLFGSAATPPTGSLFGSSPQPQSQPQQPAAAGLFGSSTASTNPGQPSTNSLFGSSTAQTSSAGGLFGSTAPSPATTGGLFASSTNNNAPQATGGLFGSSINSSAPASGGLFGSPSVGGTNNNSFFGSKPANTSTNSPSIFGTSASTTTNANATSTSGTLLRTTRFNDLPDDVKRQLESLDGMIQNQCRLADTIKATELGREINEGTILLRQLKAEMHSTSSLINDSVTSLERLRKSLDGDVADVLRLGTGTGLAKFQLDYFLRITTGLEERMRSYEQTLEFVEIQLKGLTDRPNPAAIVPAIKAQYGTFMVLADRVAALMEQLKVVKEGFREIWRYQTGSVQDPFGGNFEDL